MRNDFSMEVLRLGRLLTAATLCAATAGAARAQVTQTVIYNFTGAKDGKVSSAAVLADTGGPSGALRALYGTTNEGGNSGDGGVFKLAPPAHGQTVWKLTPLWNFTGGAGGGAPIAPVYARTARIGKTTDLYGTTTGRNSGGDGTIFSLAGNSLTSIWNFTGGRDGSLPEGAVIADQNGALYTTASGGGSRGCGTVIMLTPPANGNNWTETTIWSFKGNDGCLPSSGLVAGDSGALYGTTASGGASGGGAAFKLTPPAQGKTTWTEQTLWSFGSGTDGNTPFAALTAGTGGVFYGTTELGGGNTDCAGGRSCGIVFELTPPQQRKSAWQETVIWRFSGIDGDNPDASLIIDKNGTLYGDTLDGVNGQNGCVFKLTPPAQGGTAWTESTLWAFSGSDGAAPEATLAADKSGVLYGTTLFGGASGNGVVFSLAGTGFVPQ